MGLCLFLIGALFKRFCRVCVVAAIEGGMLLRSRSVMGSIPLLRARDLR